MDGYHTATHGHHQLDMAERPNRPLLCCNMRELEDARVSSANRIRLQMGCELLPPASRIYGHDGDELRIWI